MRILHTSDWHLGRTLEGHDRHDEQAGFIDELCAIVDSERVDLVLVAGDVFDGANPPARAEQLYYDGLERLAAGGRRAVVVIAGNHDSPDRIYAANPLATRHGISLVGRPGDCLSPGGPETGARRVAGGPGWVEVAVPGADAAAVICTLAYPSEARLNEVIGQTLGDEAQQLAYSQRVEAFFHSAAQAFAPDKVNLVVGHFFASGGWESDSERQIQLGGALAVEPRALPPGAAYIALGHLHRPQAVGGAPAPCRYSGSPLAYSFAEADQQKEVVLVEATPGVPAAVRPIKLSAGLPLRRVSVASVAEALAWCEDTRNHQCWVDLTVGSESPLTAADATAIRKLHQRLISIHWQGQTAQPAAVGQRLAELSVADRFRLFCQRQLGGEPAAELVDLFLELVNEEEEATDDEAAQA